MKVNACAETVLKMLWDSSSMHMWMPERVNDVKVVEKINVTSQILTASTVPLNSYFFSEGVTSGRKKLCRWNHIDGSKFICLFFENSSDIFTTVNFYVASIHIR